MYEKDRGLESLYLAGIHCSKCIKYTTIKRCNFPATLKRTVLRSWDPREIERQTPLEGERERERESSLENTLPLSADAVKTWPTSLSRWLAGSECILELENKKGWLAKLVAKSVTRARYSITLSYCKSLYEIFRERVV